MNDASRLRDYIRENRFTYKVLTYGCQMNDHETEKLRGILEGIGYAAAPDTEHADFIIFNTCCVREAAEQKIFGNIGALKQAKADRGDMIIAVCGCMTQQKDVADRLFRTFPFVDIIFGTHNIHKLADYVARRLEGQGRVLAVEAGDDGIRENIPVVRGDGPLASVNIMYGCDNFCSYCVVPYVRGRERSREARHIIAEIRGLEQAGYKEVMLLGQNVNSYRGRDVGNFSSLIRRICESSSIDRLRFMTSHPKDLSAELVRELAVQPQLCKQIHLPVQSGSSAVLRAMNRGYTREEYLEKISMVRRAVPGIVITSDIIVGFPGETESDFRETLSLLERAQFDAAFTFVYSRRGGTAAAGRENAVPHEEQTRRIVELVNLQNGITERKNREWVGREEAVLLERVSTRDRRHVCGRTDGGKMVNLEGGRELIGKIKTVRITEAKRTTLFGKLVN
jgi:tRNA-2-methylthio-N6-dimethylallyladenosine synthase